MKVGGILPRIPIFAGLSALGSIAEGTNAISQTVIDAKNVKEKRNKKAKDIMLLSLKLPIQVKQLKALEICQLFQILRF